MEAATPDPDVLGAQIIQEAAAGRLTVGQTRDILNELLSQQRDGDTLTVLTPDEISALPKISNACLLDNVVQKGGSTVIAGPPASARPN
jgi:hypothetical protein